MKKCWFLTHGFLSTQPSLSKIHGDHLRHDATMPCSTRRHLLSLAAVPRRRTAGKPNCSPKASKLHIWKITYNNMHVFIFPFLLRCKKTVSQIANIYKMCTLNDFRWHRWHQSAPPRAQTDRLPGSTGSRPTCRPFLWRKKNGKTKKKRGNFFAFFQNGFCYCKGF